MLGRLAEWCEPGFEQFSISERLMATRKLMLRVITQRQVRLAMTDFNRNHKLATIGETRRE